MENIQQAINRDFLGRRGEKRSSCVVRSWGAVEDTGNWSTCGITSQSGLRSTVETSRRWGLFFLWLSW